MSEGDSVGANGRLDLVDAHVHVFPPELIRDRESLLERDRWFGELYRPPRARMATAEQVVESMGEEGVDLAVLVGFPFSDPGLCGLVNDYLLETVAAYPGRLAGLACVAPDAPGAVAELERCLDAGLRGCGELAPDAGARLDAVAGHLRERGAPLLVHASEPVGHDYPGKGRFGPEHCFGLAAAHPGLTIVLAHFGGGLFVYEAMPETRKTLASVFYDTAAAPYLYNPGIYQAVESTAGIGKLIFGSDYPLLAPSRYRPGLEGLSPSAQEAVLAGNARKVFGL
jgi:predicted TIM-barrel fold metal-dependent hydrolase